MSLTKTYGNTINDILKYIVDDCTGKPSNPYISIGAGATLTTYQGHNCYNNQNDSSISIVECSEFEVKCDFYVPGQWAFSGIFRDNTFLINASPSTDCGGATVCKTNVPKNQWYNFHAVAKNNHIDLYINNSLVASKDVTLTKGIIKFRGASSTNPSYMKNIEFKGFS